MTTPHLTPAVGPSDMSLIRRWTAALLSSPDSIPMAFTYSGQDIAGLPREWNPVSARRRVDANIVETIHTATDPVTGLNLRVEVTEYSDFPVVEWVAWLTNTGAGSTPLISNVRALDATFAGTDPVLTHCNGDFCNIDGYKPTRTPIAKGDTLTQAPTGGRSCDRAYPYYRLQFADAGLTLAIGWPAQWSGTFTGTSDGVAISAGQERLSAKLKPGESIRTPRITLLAHEGDEARGVNVWRRWYRAHILPRVDGQPLAPTLQSAATDEGEEFTGATAQNQLRYQAMMVEKGFDLDVWWIDAGWYPCRNEDGDRRWVRTGTWRPDPERFPNGLAKIGVQATQLGMRFLLWFEPERVTPGSELYETRPEWLLRRDKPDTNTLLNLGNPECRQWLTDNVCDLIRESGIGVYRQDFNFEPLEFWRDNDADDRQGMNENLHVQGYLKYWDDLLERNPGLWIDSCASGGRRNDLETMRRSVPLHYTDHGYGDHPTKLAFHHTLFSWIPYFREMTVSWDQYAKDHPETAHMDSFSFHCAMAPMLGLIIDIKRDTAELAEARMMVDVWRKAVPYIAEGDYYPLTPFSREPDCWVALQFARPEHGDGVVQAIRLPDAPQDTFTAQLAGIDVAAAYDFENPETGERVTRAGSELARDGFVISGPRRSGAVWLYQRR